MSNFLRSFWILIPTLLLFLGSSKAISYTQHSTNYSYPSNYPQYTISSTAQYTCNFPPYYGPAACDDTPASCESEPCLECCENLFSMSAELIYFRAIQRGLTCHCGSSDIEDTTINGVLSSVITQNRNDPNYKWNPGFRIALGYDMTNCSSWEIEAKWTHIYNNANAQKGSNRFNWSSKFDTLDTMIERNYNPGQCIVLTPFLGVRYACIHQHLHTHFVNNVTSEEGTGSDIENVRAKQKFSGVGPILGVEANWDIGCDLSLYASADAGTIYGKFDTNHKESLREANSTTTRTNSRRKITASPMVVDCAAGIRWKIVIDCDLIAAIKLGFEHHRYFHQNRFAGHGDLKLDGVNLGASLQF